jgi:hypothetical protein
VSVQGVDTPGWILGGGLLALAAFVGGAAVAGRRAAINKIDEKARKYPDQTKILIDMARAGTCGLSAEDRQAFARQAQRVGEAAEDRAVSGSLLDLSYYLKKAYDEPESRELCAAGIGAAWRAEHPFRKVRPGDPYDVLRPHVDDASSVLALDRARRLPKPPPATMLERADELHLYETFNMGGPPSVPYSRSLALGLLGSARSELRSALLSTPESRSSARHSLERAIEIVDRALAWAQNSSLKFDAGMETLHAVHDAPEARKVRGRGERVWQDRVKLAFDFAQKATQYVNSYNNWVRQLRAEEELAQEPGSEEDRQLHLNLARKLQAMFPDFYTA